MDVALVERMGEDWRRWQTFQVEEVLCSEALSESVPGIRRTARWLEQLE